MNNDTFKIVGRFLLLIPIQVLIANKLNIFGFLIPQICLLFVLWYPLKEDITDFLLITFVFGILLDMFGNSGGVNTASLLLLAYIRTPFIKFLFNDRDIDFKLFKFSNYSTLQKLILVLTFTTIHQFILYLLEYFNLFFLGTILWKTIANSLFTTFVIVIFITILTPSKK